MAIIVKILGSNSASFAHNRHHTCQILQVKDKYLMIDCGEGTQLQCKRYNVKLSKIDHILISHLHGDHYYGLIGLLSTMHLYGRQKELTLAGPPGLKEIISLQLRYSETRLNFSVAFTEWVPENIQTVLETERFTVDTIPLDHRVPCSGYLIKEKPNRRRINRELLKETLPPSHLHALKSSEDVYDEDGKLLYRWEDVTKPPLKNVSYAYCSDTRFKPDIIEQIKDSDLVYHEATFADDMKKRAYDTYHTTAKQAASIARDAEVSQLLIGHFSTRYKDLDVVLEEARAVFPHTSLAIEGNTFNA
ncbi:MAG: ribonuclease Z [Cyclobacteriaceae bacterium]